ncbi:cupin domain-containing protein [Cohnella luojiensis]|uniref:Acireductone dioxygenase n=1 Tax=Cohnella luojiensis TaxID=652876 RepID=A0A4Y8LWE2_9BACL|nr:cupin domain-containing protein [Cohnella luojiensis]TFE24903.1 cupin domain-containing protein [Cohnella luojiensis]
MAQIRIRNTNERIENEDQVLAFLTKQNVLYEHWDKSKLPEYLHNKFTLTDDDKNAILAAYDEEIHEIAGRRGYKVWDIVALSEATPDLPNILKKFEQVHTHTEDEVRAITAGRGIFIIKGDEETGYFDVELTVGDVISVPEGQPHFFTLMDNKAIVAVRLFIEPAGWVADPFDDPAFVK